MIILITLVISGLRAPPSAAETVHARTLALTLHGLRPGSGSMLPGKPLTPDPMELLH